MQSSKQVIVIAKFERLSPKQFEIYKFIYSKKKTLICDGAVRTGKTVHMTNAFIMWAMEHFDRQNFGICGKTVASAERNIISPLMSLVSMNQRYQISYRSKDHLLTVKRGEKENYFYIFGGKDESSYTLIQGITLAGVLLDEVALMPESFVQQAIARTITVREAKYWFNCNPGHPGHWFLKDWIENEERTNKKHLHFSLEDNPVLSDDDIAEIKRGFSGVFYERYIMGRWVLASGRVYPMFNKKKNIFSDGSTPTNENYYVTIDYGTYNPFSMGLWKYKNGVGYRIKEYYYNGREKQVQKTPEDYYEDLLSFTGDLVIQSVIVDPSAAEFITTIYKKGKYRVEKAVNDVISGIGLTSSLLRDKKLLFHESCENSIAEFGLYSWDLKASTKSGVDKVIKENDHAMDEIRYFVNTVMRRDYDYDNMDDFFVSSVSRR